MKNTLTIAIAFVLAVTAAAGVAYWFGRQDRAAPASVARDTHASADADAELDRIRTAEEQPDPYKRCIDYPNPKEFDWSKAEIESMCKPLNRRMLSWQDIEKALAENHPEKLQAAFDDYQARSEAGEHGFLEWTYWWMFYKPSKWSGETTQRWVEEDPASAHALVARGIHETALAWQARGSDTGANTSAEQFANAAAHVAKARADFEAALTKNPRHIAAYYGLLSTSQLVSDRDEEERRRRWIDASY